MFKNQMPKRGHRLLYWVLVFTIAGLDQASKLVVQQHLVLGQSRPVVDGLLQLTLVLNQGAAFGLLPGKYLLFLGTAMGLIAAASYYAVNYNPNVAMQTGLGLVSGGALGNLIDRLWHGGVLDFIDLGFWPVFNLADSAIVVGTSWLALCLLNSRA